MGALAPLTNWIHDDDLLLKNAVEAGASLESLAKGAVCFSRRFTLRELQDRWYTLLYNSGTSTETSSHMIEIDVDLATSNPSKGNRNCNLKGNNPTSGKRKGDSIKDHYYAWKKRVKNGSSDTENPGSIVAHYPPLATGTVYNQYQADKIYPGEHVLNCYGYSEAGYDHEHSIFPEMLGLSSAISGGNNSHPEFHAEYGRSAEEECTNGIVDRDYMCDFEENISPKLVDETQLNKPEESFDNDYVQKDPPQFLEENLVSLDATKDIHENKMNQPLLASQPFDSKIKEISPASENANYGNAHNKSSLHVTGCGDSSNNLGCSPIKTCMPHSDVITDISPQTMMMDMHIEGESLPMGDNINKLELNSLSTDVDVLDRVSDIGLNEPAMISESDLIDFSGDFMEFADDEDLIFINIDDKDIGDSSCLNGLSSILLNSPSNAHEDDHANLSDLKETDNLDISVNILEDNYSEATKQNCDQIWSVDNDLTESVSRQNFPTSSSKVSHVAETLEELPFCALNIEDPEIPCNDDALLTAQLLAPQFSATTKLLSADGKLPLVDTNKVKEEQIVAHSAISPYTTIPSALSKVGLLNSNNNGKPEPKSVERIVTDGVSRDVGLAAKEKTPCTLQAGALHSSAGTLLKEEYKFDTLGNLSLEIPAAGTDHAKLQTPNSADGCKSQAISTSDQELQASESEEDVPSFSDVESLILDMDLGPYDQESCLFTKEVSLYQPVHNKQMIMRLEQSAIAYMKRKISANGAIAVIYGRYLKYFMKKPEVSLGRGTDDLEVDIDLREEGPANRISRRQAIIKLDKDGSFVLKNMGKCSIFVQSKEVPSKKRIVLSSMCLIQIRALRFLFHYNEDAVMSYLDTANQASRGRTT